MWIRNSLKIISSFLTPRNQIFLRTSDEWISWRFSVKIFMSSHSSEDLRWISSEELLKIFRRKILWRFCFKIFSSKNIRKICINFLQKIFIKFLSKIFLRSSRDHQLKSFWYLRKIFGSNLLRSTEELLVFVLILNFENN